MRLVRAIDVMILLGIFVLIRIMKPLWNARITRYLCALDQKFLWQLLGFIPSVFRVIMIVKDC